MAVKLATKLKRFYGLGRYDVLKRTRTRARKMVEWSYGTSGGHGKLKSRQVRHIRAAGRQRKTYRTRKGLTIAPPLAATGGAAYAVRRRRK